MTYACEGCGLRTCNGRCFNECPSDYEPTKVDRYARFLESCERALEEQAIETKELPNGRFRVAA